MSEQRTHTISFLRKEVKCLKNLERENQELSSLLSDHQYALELVMNRYRRFADKIVVNQPTLDEGPYNSKLLHKELIDKLKDKIEEMTSVLAQAEQINQAAEFYQKTKDEYLKSLKHDNQILRKILFEQILSQDGDDDDDESQITS